GEWGRGGSGGAGELIFSRRPTPDALVSNFCSPAYIRCLLFQLRRARRLDLLDLLSLYSTYSNLLK
ncbi:hypothetical protein, partial [Aerosakkonema funiforme]|uniref:hypothetical protein n=1 Tax=Aerosakkonema funiforme TaxID=1246630 RepID=UPI001A7E4F62